MKNYLYLVCCLLISGSLYGQIARISSTFNIDVPPVEALAGSIQGKVETTDGQPASFVSIVLKGTPKGTLSAEDGSFQIKNVREGQYTLQARMVGFRSVEQAIRVVAGQTSILDLALAESAESLAEIVVSGLLRPRRQLCEPDCATCLLSYCRL